MDMVNRSQSLSSVEFLSGPLVERSFPLNKQIIAIGRAPTNDIVVPDQSVSGQHAQLFNNGEQWYIKKVTPTNTVTINFQQRVENTPVALNNDDTIHLGGMVNFRFHLVPAGAVSGAIPVSSPASNGPNIAPSQPLFSPQEQVPQQPFGQPLFSPQEQVPQQSLGSHHSRRHNHRRGHRSDSLHIHRRLHIPRHHPTCRHRARVCRLFPARPLILNVCRPRLLLLAWLQSRWSQMFTPISFRCP